MGHPVVIEELALLKIKLCKLLHFPNNMHVFKLFFPKMSEYRVSVTGCPKKSVPQNPKRYLFFTKTYCQGMKVIVFGKCNRPRGPRPVELIYFNKIYSSLDSETNG